MLHGYGAYCMGVHHDGRSNDGYIVVLYLTMQISKPM